MARSPFSLTCMAPRMARLICRRIMPKLSADEKIDETRQRGHRLPAGVDEVGVDLIFSRERPDAEQAVLTLTATLHAFRRGSPPASGKPMPGSHKTVLQFFRGTRRHFVTIRGMFLLPLRRCRTKAEGRRRASARWRHVCRAPERKARPSISYSSHCNCVSNVDGIQKGGRWSTPTSRQRLRRDHSARQRKTS